MALSLTNILNALETNKGKYLHKSVGVDPISNRTMILFSFTFLYQLSGWKSNKIKKEISNVTLDNWIVENDGLVLLCD